MQPKESKSSRHFWFSMIKSFLRIIGCWVLAYHDLGGAAILLGLAEVLGVVEEF
jgi:hypothetical protein